jgi:hypothetical protein
MAESNIMVTPISKLEMIVLAWISSDYEALHTIDKNVSEDADRNVQKVELHSILVGLQTRGLAASYTYNEGTTQFDLETGSNGESIEKYWWLATIEGQHVLDMEPGG